MITQKEINDFIKKIDYEHYERDTVTKEERQIIRKALNNNDIFWLDKIPKQLEISLACIMQKSL